MATADKLTTVAENVPKVYDAGLASFVNTMSDGGTNFSGMFAYLTSAYTFDEETSDSYMLYINRPNFTTIPLIDTSKGIDFSSMFACCAMLTTIPQLNTSNGKDFNYMFNGCTNLTTIPLINTSNGTSFNYMFYKCTSLTTLPQLNVSKGTSFNYMFGSSTTNSCTSLTTISFVENCIGANISFKYCDALSHDSLISILNGLKTVTSTRTCTLGATNLAKLTDEEKAIATQKNWTLAS